MTAHPLDRPAWSALTTRQSHLALGNERALRFETDFAMFAAARDDSAESLRALVEIMPESGSVILLQAGKSIVPPGAVAEFQTSAVQMVAKQFEPCEPTGNIVPLSEADAPQMRALADLAKPGPFQIRTHELGQFWGIKENGQLVAMVGERMQPAGYGEVSGVCTHPDVRGRGYAGLLSRVVATQIKARGETPFLHAMANNTPAITLYETLGFVLRANFSVTVLRREGPA